VTPGSRPGTGSNTCLQLFESQDYVLELPFHLEEYVGFLLTQSNVTAAVEEGRESAEDLRAWMTRGLGDVFGARQRSTRFGGYIWYLRPA
jgi:hypothetical protein